MGRELPEYPTLFAKFPDTLLGAHDDLGETVNKVVKEVAP